MIPSSSSLFLKILEIPAKLGERENDQSSETKTRVDGTHLFRLASFPKAPIFLIIILAEETVLPIEILSVEAFRILKRFLFPLPALPFNGSMKLGAKLELLGRRLPNPG